MDHSTIFYPSSRDCSRGLYWPDANFGKIYFFRLVLVIGPQIGCCTSTAASVAAEEDEL